MAKPTIKAYKKKKWAEGIIELTDYTFLSGEFQFFHPTGDVDLKVKARKDFKIVGTNSMIFKEFKYELLEKHILCRIKAKNIKCVWFTKEKQGVD